MRDGENENNVDVPAITDHISGILGADSVAAFEPRGSEKGSVDLSTILLICVLLCEQHDSQHLQWWSGSLAKSGGRNP